MKITAPIGKGKKRDQMTADVRLVKDLAPQDSSQEIAVLEFNGTKLATITVDAGGHTRMRFHAALDYLLFDRKVTVKPVNPGDLSFLEMDEEH